MVSQQQKPEKAGDRNVKSTGVLLRIRVLKEFEKMSKNKELFKAYFLGTVAYYRNIQGEIMPTTRGRPTKVDMGNYVVKFDFGGTEQMSPDDVVKYANVFHVQREIALGFRPKPPNYSVSVMSGISASQENNHSVGMKMLCAHNNWPLAAKDVCQLDQERLDFWSQARLQAGSRYPTRVDPVWFAMEGGGTMQQTDNGAAAASQASSVLTATKSESLESPRHVLMAETSEESRSSSSETKQTLSKAKQGKPDEVVSRSPSGKKTKNQDTTTTSTSKPSTKRGATSKSTAVDNGTKTNNNRSKRRASGKATETNSGPKKESEGTEGKSGQGPGTTTKRASAKKDLLAVAASAAAQAAVAAIREQEEKGLRGDKKSQSPPETNKSKPQKITPKAAKSAGKVTESTEATPRTSNVPKKQTDKQEAKPASALRTPQSRQIGQSLQFLADVSVQAAKVETLPRNADADKKNASTNDSSNDHSLSPTTRKKPVGSKRGQSDGSSDCSIHRAGTPKSCNIQATSVASEGKAPDLPDLQERVQGKGPNAASRLSISQHKSKETTRPPKSETNGPGQKRALEKATMEPPRPIKRQKSAPDRPSALRPPSIIHQHRQRSTGSRLSFAEDVQVAEAAATISVSERKPTALKKGDRQQSLESLQPPSVIRAADRQFSVESLQSLRSQESGASALLQALTPNSRLTPSLGPVAPMSPSADTPTTAKMEDIYSQLDQYMDSPGTKPDESPSSKGLTFRPRPLNARRQSSAATVDFMRADVKLPFDSSGASVSSGANLSTHTGLELPSESDDVASLKSSLNSGSRFGKSGKESPRGSQRDVQFKIPLPDASRSPASDGLNPLPMNDQFQPAPLQDAGIQAWLSGSAAAGPTPDPVSQQMRRPQPQRSIPRGAPMRSASEPVVQSMQYQYPPHLGRAQPPRVQPPQPFYENQQLPPDHFMQRAVSYDSRAMRGDRYGAVGGRRIVEFGHPRDEVVEGQEIYSRHTLFLWGAHRSDVSPANGNAREGCDSIIFNNEEQPASKDDLEFVQFKCSQRNGGGALMTSYRRSQRHTHTCPVRVFRKTAGPSGNGYRYDGLYTVVAIYDDNGRPRSDLTNASKFFSFLLKRNRIGRAIDENRLMLDDLWDIIRQDSMSANGRRGDGTGQGGPTGAYGHHLNLPRLSHHGAYRGGNQRAVSQPALKRTPSSEVSVVRIRYYNNHVNPIPWHPTGVPLGYHGQGPPATVPLSLSNPAVYKP